MESHKKSIMVLYKPIVDLQGTSKWAVNELKKASADREKQTEMNSGSSLATAPSGSSSSSSAAPKFGKVLAYLQSIAEGELAALFKANVALLATQTAGDAIYVPAG